MTKSRPIIFKDEMVRAILEGRKTQTRRIVLADVPENMDRALHVGVGSFEAVLRSGLFRFSENNTGEMWPNGPFSCPYGKPGDRLWVREAFCANEFMESTYRADGGERPPCGWTPSIHMWRWASRITLEITGLRVERLQDLTEEDAQTEGLVQLSKDGGTTWKWGVPDSDGRPGNDDHGWHWKEWKLTAKEAFKSLWGSINGTDSWDANPWVWVIEFNRIDQEPTA